MLGEEVMPNKEYVKVMAETGLDLDQRRELIQHWYVRNSAAQCEFYASSQYLLFKILFCYNWISMNTPPVPPNILKAH